MSMKDDSAKDLRDPHGFISKTRDTIGKLSPRFSSGTASDIRRAIARADSPNQNSSSVTRRFPVRDAG